MKNKISRYSKEFDDTVEYSVYWHSRTNSTFFTSCCSVAICDDEERCPVCEHKIIGHDAAGNHSRRMTRWNCAKRRGY